MFTSRLFYFILLNFLILLPSRGLFSLPNTSTIRPSVLLSLDGFRYDYLDFYEEQLPYLNSLRSKGSSFELGLINAYPTITFVNHRTLATGLWTESHGIVANYFYDPILKDEFSKWDSMNETQFWDDSTPIWMVAETNGIKTACLQFPGCDVPSQRPTYTMEKPYSDTTPFTEMVEEAERALNDAQNPAKFLVLYFGEPDTTGHAYGPFSIEMEEKLLELDKDVRTMVETLGEDVDYILTSDHGMTEVVEYINVDSYLDNIKHMCEYIDDIIIESYIQIFPYKDNLTEVLLLTKELKEKHVDKFDFYTKDKIEDRYFFKHNVRTAPLFLIGRYGHVFTQGVTTRKGDHGYDNLKPQMHPFFIAVGPSFKPNYSSSSSVYSVDVYPLIAKLLGIKTHPEINGTIDRIQQVLI